MRVKCALNKFKELFAVLRAYLTLEGKIYCACISSSMIEEMIFLSVYMLVDLMSAVGTINWYKCSSRFE